MRIIKPTEDQFQAVRGFYHSMIDAMAASGAPVYVGWKKDIYPAPEFLAESIRKGETYLVVEDGRILAAMVLNHEYNEEYNKYDWPTKAEDSEILVIHALGVHPAFSGKGYAGALVQEAIDQAGKTGMKVIRLDVLEGNTPAEELYSAFGFQYMTTLPMYYEDTGWMNFRLFEYLV